MLHCVHCHFSSGRDSGSMCVFLEQAILWSNNVAKYTCHAIDCGSLCKVADIREAYRHPRRIIYSHVNIVSCTLWVLECYILMVCWAMLCPCGT